jgi:carbamoylphosphate synthase small subunit
LCVVGFANVNTAISPESLFEVSRKEERHPEAAPGPHDAEHHFQRFIKLLEEKSV